MLDARFLRNPHYDAVLRPVEGTILTVVRETAEGDWEVLDSAPGGERIVDTLDGGEDGRAQADALARDYIAVGRFRPWAGPAPGEAIPEQGGADAYSDRRPRSAARQ